MNYHPFCGYWFYRGPGDANTAEMAAFYCSWGLLAVAPVVAFIGILRQMLMHHGG